jgi:hypothetical protein
MTTTRANEPRCSTVIMVYIVLEFLAQNSSQKPQQPTKSQRTINTMVFVPTAAFAVALLSFAEGVSADVNQHGAYDRSKVENVGVTTSANQETVTTSFSSSIVWENLAFVVHRNGEPEACGSAIPDIETLTNESEKKLDKYQVENLITQALSKTLPTSNCGSPDNATAPEGLLSFCDMGPDRTPILLDHQKLVRLPGGSLPCRWFTREGLRIASLEHLKELALAAKSSAQICKNTSDNDDSNEIIPETCGGDSVAELHLYGVQGGRVFMFAPSHVGEVFELSHLTMNPDPNKPVTMKVLSLSPRVFDIINIFPKEDADDLVARALRETSPTHKIKRSTTGTTENTVFNKRTSENAFDT